MDQVATMTTPLPRPRVCRWLVLRPRKLETIMWHCGDALFPVTFKHQQAVGWTPLFDFGLRPT
jgi:hypothetical protein